MGNFSTINIRGGIGSKTVKITSDSKPDFDSLSIEKWQYLIDTVAKIVNVPSALIMRLNENSIEVFLKSNSVGNPYKEGEKAKLIYGLYCETVIGTQKELLVPDATKSPVWKNNNPDKALNMISYLGLPINWPDGECFGTVCLLDNRENYYNADIKGLLSQIKLHIETDLEMLIKNNELNEKNRQLEELNNVKTRFISLISHDVRGNIGTLDELLKLIIVNFEKYDKSELLPMLKSLSINASTSYQTLENLLNWSKNDLVQLKPEIISLNIVDVIEIVLSSFMHEINIKSIHIVKEYYSNTAYIDGDEKMWIVVIRNILSNALKYTERSGTVIIRVRLVGKQHIIEIEDSGIGISQSSMDKLFTYNSAYSAQGTSGESSAGIGLMLVKEFIDKNNAEISVESQVGKGSIFRMSIPNILYPIGAK